MNHEPGRVIASEPCHNATLLRASDGSGIVVAAQLLDRQGTTVKVMDTAGNLIIGWQPDFRFYEFRTVRMNSGAPSGSLIFLAHERETLRFVLKDMTGRTVRELLGLALMI